MQTVYTKYGIRVRADFGYGGVLEAERYWAKKEHLENNYSIEKWIEYNLIEDGWGLSISGVLLGTSEDGNNTLDECLKEIDDFICGHENKLNFRELKGA